MRNLFPSFVFTLTGAFAIWLAKGFKGSFNDVMVRIDDRHSAKGVAQLILGLGMWIAIVAILSVLLSRPADTKTYRGRVNEKGEIELEEIK
jgi:hypothetical protein